MRRAALACLPVVCVASSVVAVASPIHYYRGEAGAETVDSISGISLTGTPSVTSSIGDFDNPVPLTGDTNGQAFTAPASTANVGGVVSNDDGLTVEAYVNISAFAANSQETVAAQWGTGGAENQVFRLNFQAAGDGVDGTGANGDTYRMILVQNQRFNGGGAIVNSNSDPAGGGNGDIALIAGNDYYIAAVFDNTADTVTYYAQDLTAGGPLQTRTVNRAFGNWEDAGDGTAVSAPISIGEIGGGAQPFTGVLDEVRISNSALSADDLLVVPEPGSMALGLMGAGLVLLRRRQHTA
ncbi:MAG: PEP-CTERM sorting domain-containing protein [Planctomycetota bacterium]